MSTVKLIHYSEITELRNFGKEKVNQRLEVEVDYNPEEDNFEVENVYIIQGEIKLEVSKLLDKAEGHPLHNMLEAIDWKEIYSDYKEKQEKTYGKVNTYDKVQKPGFNMADFANGLANTFFGNREKSNA